MNNFNILRELKEINHKLSHLQKLGENIMTAISDFAAAQATYNTQIDASLADISTEIAALNAEIVTLQNSAGQISADDQASLDAIQAHSQSLAAKLAALDTINPPVPPVVPPAA